MNERLNLIKDLMAAYPNFNPRDLTRTVKVYADAFKDTPVWALQPAVEYLRDNGSAFFPTVSEINRIIRQLDPQPPREQTPAGDYWQQMTNLAHALRGADVDVELPAGQASEYDDLDADELQQMADAKAAYVEH